MNIPSHKKYEGKVERNIPGETREQEIKRVNEHSRLSGVVRSARERHARRHLGKKGTSKAEALETFKRYSKDS